MLKRGKFSHVDMLFFDADFKPGYRDWTSGPDDFELEIGNTLVYTVPLLEKTDYFKELKEKWLPFYNEELRIKRLKEVEKYFFNNLDHIPLYAERELLFQAFDRLYNALREFLQALFISRKTYPIAYDKWIREQIEDILKLPTLYKKLVSILQIKDFQSKEISCSTQELGNLWKEYILEELK